MMFRRRLFILHVAAVVLSSCLLQAADDPRQGEGSPSVTVVIDYADGVEKHFTGLRWKKGMTVMSAMEAARAHPRGIRFEFRGKGATALLTKIDDLANQGKGRNWLFRVNGKLGTKSFGVQELSAGDVVLWRFEEYR